MTETESAQPTVSQSPENTIAPVPLPRWARWFLPLVPAGLTFGPFLIAIPTGSIIAYAGAGLTAFALTVCFGTLMWSIRPSLEASTGMRSATITQPSASPAPR